MFWALFGAIYLCFGMPEVYRVLFEVFGMDPDAEECEPRLRRQLEDVDYVSVEFEDKKISWQDMVAYKASFMFILNSTVNYILCYCFHLFFGMKLTLVFMFSFPPSFLFSLPKMLYLHTLGSSELVSHLACTDSGEIYGITIADHKSCKH